MTFLLEVITGKHGFGKNAFQDAVLACSSTWQHNRLLNSCRKWPSYL